MYKKFNTIVKIVNITISFYIQTSNENSKKSDFFIFNPPQHEAPQYQQIPQRKY